MSLTGIRMKVNLAHKQYHLNICHLQLSCKLGESALNIFWIIMFMSLSSCVSRTYEIARGSSHCMWIFFYFVLFFLFCPFSLNFNWLNTFHLTFRIFSYHKTYILFLFFFIWAKVDLFLYVNFWSCLWVHWVNWCQLTTALELVWVNKFGRCLARDVCILCPTGHI